MVRKNKDEKCIWKKVAKNDLEKLARGNSCITLRLDKPCYNCDGTKEYAEKINCRAYWCLEEK